MKVTKFKGFEKFKIGQNISDEEGWRQVVDILDDGEVFFSNQEGEEWSRYYPQHDKVLGKNGFRGVVVKLSKNKDFKGFTEHYYTNKAMAKYWAENQAKKNKIYYRIEDTILIKCSTCSKVRKQSETICGYCMKMRNN